MQKKLRQSTYDQIFSNLVGFSTIVFFLPLSDAANVPKIFIQTVIALFVGANFCLNYNYKVLLRKSSIPFFVYGILLICTLLFHNSIYLSLFGNVGRLNGFLNYFSLLFVAIGVLLIQNKELLIKVLFFVGIFETVYASMQILEIDPIFWNNPYGNAIGTLANTDFLSAFIGFSSISTLYFLYKSKKKSRKFYGILWLFQFVVLVFAGAYQGIVLSLIGLFGYLVIYQKKSIKTSAIVIALVSLPICLFGIFGHGPASFLHKISVQFRGDYWRAASDLIKDNFILGVGFGRFQDYYRTYRDYKAIGRRGPMYITDSAHSIYLDIAIAGGMFLLVSFLSIILFVILKNLRQLRNLENIDHRRYFFMLLLIAYLAQGLISMDALGMAIWGWVAIGALSANDLEVKKMEVNTKNIAAQVSLLFMSIVLTGLFGNKWVMSDFASKNLSNWYALAELNGGKVDSIEPVKRLANASIGIPTYQNEAGLAYLKLGDFDSAEKILSLVANKFPLNFDSHYYLASGYEVYGNYENAVKIREKIMIIDPLNMENYIQLMKDYLAIGDQNSALRLRGLIAENPDLSKEISKLDELLKS